MSNILFLIFEIIGTISFAISGAMIGLKKKMDIFGIVILGLTTAVGGGVIRDLILGITPPATFRNPIYAIVSILTAIIIFIPIVQRFLNKKQHLIELINLWMDSIGLGIFTAIGIRTAYEISSEYNVFLMIFVGIVTGVGGGVLRDILAGNTPFIFIKHFYASASALGAIICIVLWNILGSTFSMLISTVVIILLRLCAAHFRWSLPRAK